MSVDKEDLREFTGAFREIRRVYWKGNLGSVEAEDKEQGEKERHGCVTALQKPRQDILSIQTTVKRKGAVENPRWRAEQRRRILLRWRRDSDRPLANSLKQYISGPNPVRVTQVQEASAQQESKAPKTKQGLPLIGIPVKPRKLEQLKQKIEAGTVPPSGRPPVLGSVPAPTPREL